MYIQIISISQTNKPLVHHMTLFECSTSAYPSSDPISWDIWVKSSGAVCNSNLLTPRDWDACITPVAVWTISSTGKYTPLVYFAWQLDFNINRTVRIDLKKKTGADERGGE